MFFPVRSNTGAVLPFEQHYAAAGTYESGMVLNIGNDGLLKECTEGVPQFMCVSNVTAAENVLITVAPVSTDVVYRCNKVALNADQEPFVGAKVELGDNGFLGGEGTDGSFLITAVLEDGSVEGRFIK